MRFTATVTIDAPTGADAQTVLHERLGHDEDLGFDYTVRHSDAVEVTVAAAVTDIINAHDALHGMVLDGATLDTTEQRNLASIAAVIQQLATETTPTVTGDEASAEPGPHDVEVVVVPSAGSDGAVVVMIDTPWEPDASDGSPGLRVVINDEHAWGPRYEPNREDR